MSKMKKRRNQEGILKQELLLDFSGSWIILESIFYFSESTDTRLSIKFCVQLNIFLVIVTEIQSLKKIDEIFKWKYHQIIVCKKSIFIYDVSFGCEIQYH